MRFISRYLDFIFEAVAKKEMRLYYSDEFRNMLKRLQDKSSIAQALLSAENSNQITDVYTLIDVTDKNDTISLIQVNRIIRDNPDLIDTLPYSIRDKSRGSDFWSKARTEMKIGRWVKRIFTEVHKSSLEDSKIEQFVNQYKSTFDMGSSSLDLVRGEEIRKWYLESNYEIVRGQLGNSCMRYRSCQNYLDIYVKNPEVCGLLIMRSSDNPDKIVGRALVWKLKDGTNYQDRVYTIHDSDREIFENWADRNNYSTYNSSYKTMEVQLGNHEYSEYPYMDTFVCYNPVTKLLSSNEELWPDYGYYMLQNTDGTFRSDDVVYSNWHDEYIPRNQAVRCENVEDWLHRDEAKYLEYKDIWVAPNDDVVFSEYDDEYYLIDDCVYSELMEEWLYRKVKDLIEVITDENGSIDYCVKSRIDLYIKVGDNYYSRIDCIKDPFTNEWKFKTREYEKELDEKLMTDFNIERNDNTLDRNGSPVTKIVEQVRDDLKTRLLKLKLSDDLKNEIVDNLIYKNQVRGVYWGLNKDDMPDEEDMFALIKAYIITPNRGSRSTSYQTSLMGSFVFYRSEEMNKYERKFKNFHSVGVLYRMIKVCESFDYSKLPDDIYKRYLFISI